MWTITSKGQVTIPKEFRDALGLLPNTAVEFELKKGKLVVTKAETRSRGKRMVERLRGQGTVQLSTDEIMALTRGE